LRRAAAWGDGWYGFNVDGVAAVAERVTTLRALCRESDRSPEELQLAVALRDPHPSDAAALADLGVDELVVVASPPDDAQDAADWVARLADQWR